MSEKRYVVGFDGALREYEFVAKSKNSDVCVRDEDGVIKLGQFHYTTKESALRDGVAYLVSQIAGYEAGLRQMKDRLEKVRAMLEKEAAR